MADHPKRSRRGKGSEEISTQPDMEVPAELLEAGNQMNLPPARNTPAPSGTPQMMERGGASWSRQVVEGDSLELELDQEPESLGEGDGATRVFSMSDLGQLNIGPDVPMPTINQPLPMGLQLAATDPSVAGVSLSQLDGSGDFEIDDADILEANYLETNVPSMQSRGHHIDVDETIAPGSGVRPPHLDLDETIAPGSGVAPPKIHQKSHASTAQSPQLPGMVAQTIDRHHHEDIVDEVDFGDMTTALPPDQLKKLHASMPPPPGGVAPAHMPVEEPSPPRAQTPPPAPPAPAAPPAPVTPPAPPKLEESTEAGNASAERSGNLEELADVMKKKRSKQRNSRLGASKEEEPVVEAPEQEEKEEASRSNQERIRSIAEKARQRVENKSREADAPSPDFASLGQALQQMEEAQRLASEARQMMEDALAMANDLGASLEMQSGLLESQVEESSVLEASTRREARKISELGKRMAEVEQNRLPSSTRKTILRMVKELEKELQDGEGQVTARLALQLANRLFETIRRDLRPW